MIISKQSELNKLNISALAASAGISEELTEILYLRGFDAPEKLEVFLHPSKKHFIDPFKLKGIKEATERIKTARDNGETVVIFGDYDADGICATSILYNALKDYKIDAYAVIPERDNGYGLTEGMIEKVLDEYFPDLIITVDCGISGAKEVEELLNLGVDVIVTDHHEIPDIIPECTVINCKIKDQDYGFDSLCGAGVAYKLAYALIGEKADSYLDFAAIATIADSMPLVGENRDIVAEGLKIIKSPECRPQLKALLNASNIKEISSTALAYTVAPRINAAGRMGDAYSALSLFLSDNPAEMISLSQKLNCYNCDRQGGCESLYKEARAKLTGKDVTSKIVILEDDGWKGGLVGIVAAKLAEELNKPVILFVNNNGLLHGSARSIDNINIFDAINNSRDLLSDFGGHAQAAGISIEKNNLPEFEKRINKYINGKYSMEAFRKKTEVEEIIDKKFSMVFAKELSLLEPFGIGNRKPLFAVDVNRLETNPIKYGSPHLLCKTPYIDMLYFNGSDSSALFNSPVKKRIVFEPNVSFFNNSESLKGYVKAVEIEAEDSDDNRLAVLDSELSGITGEKHSFSTLNNTETLELLNLSMNEIYGTVFAVSDIRNLKFYGKTDMLGISMYRPNGRSNLNCIVTGLCDGDLSNFRKIIYLDEPLGDTVKETDALKVYVNTELKGFDKTALSTDRKIFAEIFLYLKKSNLQGMNSLEIAMNSSFTCSKEQLLFALDVFVELGFFKFRGGFLQLDGNVKADLSNSKIYSKILEMK